MRRCSEVVLVVLLLSQPEQPAARPLPSLNRRGEAGLLELPRASLLGAGRYAFGTWFNYLQTGAGKAFGAAPMSMGIGLPYHLDLGLAFTSVDPIDPEARARTIQIHALAKRRIYTTASDLLTVSGGLRLDNLLSLPDLTPLLLADLMVGDATFVLAAGFRLATDSSDSFSAPTFGAGFEHYLTRHFLLQLEARGRYAPGRGVAVTGGVGLRYRLRRSLFLVLGLDAGYEQGSVLRASLGLSFAPSGEGHVDSDDDGVIDKLDLCPDEPEDADGFQDDDGCPEEGTGDALRDRDSHRGPALLRMKIPLQPVPVWIMGDLGERARGQAPGGPARRAGRPGAGTGPDEGQPGLGEAMGDHVPLRTPVWLAPPRTLGEPMGERIILRRPDWVEVEGEE